MIINNNLAALNTHRQMGQVSGAAQNSMEKLSSGQRINKGADDAAGLSISEKMRNQIRGLEQAQRNAQDGVSLIQTADGALGQVHDILQRVRELVVQAGNGTNNTEELDAINGEIGELIDETDSITSRTKFNGISILTTSDGTVAGSTAAITLQVGANGSESLDLAAIDMSTHGLGLKTAGVSDIDVTDFATTDFDTQLQTVDDAIAAVSKQRSSFGATQNRLEFTTNNLASTSENLTAAESRVRDVDMAKEMMEFTKNNILTQASQAMLAQANQQPQAVLQLLR
ncbi:flagellin [Tetzosporium hominis]|uniref:Flagellin n=1 Tax=Tetzosporium hominis TaxID=2020506 RepID=A0A264W4D3_9BACL|nr:flagellin Hag [Tetzosporium hominis]OZS78415.1 flagellin [Tetzosporium hominis]